MTPIDWATRPLQKYADFTGRAPRAEYWWFVLLYMVGRRTREIGLRVALGASPGGILQLVVSECMSLVVIGVAVGIGLAVLAVRPMAMFLVPGVRPTDPGTFALVAGVLMAVALAATVAPALRALRVDPVTALRHE